MHGTVAGGRVTARDWNASASAIETRVIDGCLCRADWTEESGLSLTVARRAATLVSASTTANEASARVRVVGVVAVGVVFAPIDRAAEGHPVVAGDVEPADADGAWRSACRSAPTGSRRCRDPGGGCTSSWPVVVRRLLHGARAAEGGDEWAPPFDVPQFTPVRRGAALLEFGTPGLRVESVTVLVRMPVRAPAPGRRQGRSSNRRRSGSPARCGAWPTSN